jgi:hypothetical protein
MANNVNPFYYLLSKPFSTLKSDYSSITLVVKYSQNSIVQGAGYILSDNVPEESNPLNFAGYMFYIWPNPMVLFIFSSLCPESNAGCNVNSQLVNGVYAMPTDGNWHKVSIRRINSQYEFYVDDISIFKSVSTTRTATLLELEILRIPLGLRDGQNYMSI